MTSVKRTAVLLRRQGRQKTYVVLSRVQRGRLTSALPDWDEIERKMPEARQSLLAAHGRYTTQVSTPVAAVSLETAALLAAWCRVRNPARVLDLGSGFTTYLFHRERPGGDIRSIDDDQEWARKTEEFVRAETGHQPQIDGLAELEVLAERFDLVVHDLGSIDTRARWLPAITQLVAPGGVLVLDDIHKGRYQPTLRSLRAQSGQMFDLAWLTTDEYGRRAGLWLPPRDHD